MLPLHDVFGQKKKKDNEQRTTITTTTTTNSAPIILLVYLIGRVKTHLSLQAEDFQVVHSCLVFAICPSLSVTQHSHRYKQTNKSKVLIDCYPKLQNKSRLFFFPGSVKILSLPASSMSLLHLTSLPAAPDVLAKFLSLSRTGRWSLSSIEDTCSTSLQRCS